MLDQCRHMYLCETMKFNAVKRTWVTALQDQCTGYSRCQTRGRHRAGPHSRALASALGGSGPSTGKALRTQCPAVTAAWPNFRALGQGTQVLAKPLSKGVRRTV